MVTAVQQLTATMGEVGGRTTREPKGIMDAYRETYPVLLRYCQVNSVDELAPLWNRLARGSKGEQQSIIQQELTKVCVDRGLTPDLYCPAVTTSLKQMIASLNFVGNGPDDLGAGCQPFLVVYTSQAEHYRALDEANVANQLDQGTASASLADIRDIRDKEKVKLPRDLNQVSLTLRRFAILAHTLFQGPGDSNPFVKSMWLLGNKFHERLPHYLGHHQGLAGTPWWDVYASHVLRHVQINVFEYLQALQVSGGRGRYGCTGASFISRVTRDLQRGCFHMSSSWLPLPAAVTADASTAFRGEANTVGTRTTRASTAASTTSGLTASTGGGRASSGASGATAPQGTYVANPARDPEFDTLQLRPQMRDLLRAHPPPANDAGNAFCVSWWGRGGCYTNCGRASTHRPFANPGERTRLLAHGSEATAAAPWLLQAPPWPGELDDGSRRATTRARVNGDDTRLSRAEITLRKYAEQAAAKLDNSVNWEWFVATERGQADITPTVGTLPHKAARLLEHLRKRGAGVPLHTGPWSEEQLQRAAARGSHQSAKGEVEFVCTEMVEFCDQGFWVVLPLEVALTLPNLRLSPLGVVPQRNRRPRLIVDYTYPG
ncbi:adenylate kinase [Fragilaria crotonensis]|nr:adenylate kinase [Fragilaria crotonensis]